MRRRWVSALVFATLASVATVVPAGAEPTVSMSDACIAANEPVYDGRYGSTALDGPGSLGGFAQGETLRIAALGESVVAIAMLVNGTSPIIDTPPDFAIEHVFTTVAPNTALWGAVGQPITEVAQADWVVECIGVVVPVLTPFGFIAVERASGTSEIFALPVHLSEPTTQPVTVDWQTRNDDLAPLASAGSDFIAASGTLTFAPGETVAYAEITILGDGIAEPPLFGGEWGIVEFSNLSGATLDVDTFFGAGLFIIRDG